MRGGGMGRVGVGRDVGVVERGVDRRTSWFRLV